MRRIVLIGVSALVFASQGQAVQSRAELIKAAQAAFNHSNQGRACTTLVRPRMETTIDTVRPEYAKRLLLVKHKLNTVRYVKDERGGLTWAVFSNVDLKASNNNGIFIADGKTVYYCFGRWVVKDAKLTDSFASPPGQRVVIATVVLEGAPLWVLKDPGARILAQSSFQGDPASVYALNEYDKAVLPVMSTSNRVAVAIPRED